MLGQVIRLWREYRGMSPQDVVDATNNQLTLEEYLRLESNKSVRLRIIRLIRVADSLKIPVLYLWNQTTPLQSRVFNDEAKAYEGNLRRRLDRLATERVIMDIEQAFRDVMSHVHEDQ